MLLWITLSGLSLVCLCLFALMTYVGPKISTKVHVTDPPESTRPPPLNIDGYPLQTWQQNGEPTSAPTR